MTKMKIKDNSTFKFAKLQLFRLSNIILIFGKFLSAFFSVFFVLEIQVIFLKAVFYYKDY